MTFENEAQLVAYVTEELARVLPAGWDVQRVQPDRLMWSIGEGSFHMRDYLLEVSGDLRFFILYHGNSDAGPFVLHHLLLNAKVIGAEWLTKFPLSTVFSHILHDCKPNFWGLS